MSGAALPIESAQIDIARGNFYLSREVCDTYLPGVISVALLLRDEQVLILPLRAGGGGGLLLKQRNARGDRVIHAQEFCRANGFAEDFTCRSGQVRWSREHAALQLPASCLLP